MEADHLLRIVEDEILQFPLANEEERHELEEYIKKAGIWEQVSPIKRHLSREKSIPTVRGVSSSPSVVGIGVNETNQ